MYSKSVYKVYVIRRGLLFTENYDVFDKQDEAKSRKQAQINQVSPPYSRWRGGYFELRSDHGVGATARMPRLGSAGTRLDFWRVSDSCHQEEDDEENKENEDEQGSQATTSYYQDYVWRLSSEVEFCARATAWRPWHTKDRIGRMKVEVDGTSRKSFRLINEKDSEGRIRRRWSSGVSHQIGRWRAALQPVYTLKDHQTKEGPWMMIHQSDGRGVLDYTKWQSDAFSAKVMHRYFHLSWGKIKVASGTNIPLGILAGQLCSRIFPLWKLRKVLPDDLPDDAPLISGIEWEAEQAKRDREWAKKCAREKKQPSSWDRGPIVEEVFDDEENEVESTQALLPWKGQNPKEQDENQLVVASLSRAPLSKADEIVAYNRRGSLIKTGTLTVVLGTLYGLMGAFKRPSA